MAKAARSSSRGATRASASPRPDRSAPHQLEPVAEGVPHVHAAQPRDFVGGLERDAGFAEPGRERVEVVHQQRHVGARAAVDLAVLHAEVELVIAERQPDALRVRHVGRLRDASEAEPIDVEAHGFVLTAARHHQLDVVDAHRERSTTGGLKLGCSPAPAGLDTTLADGTRVSVGADGTIALFDGERPLWSTPRGAFPTARTFRERAMGPLAIWTFRRSDEETFAFDRYLGAREEEGAGVVEYGRRGDGAATLAGAPGAGASTTVVRLAIDGIGASSIAVPARCDEEGSFHGFGEQYDATDQRGHALTLLVSEQGIGRDGGTRQLAGDAHTTYFPMPYYLDARGFGVLVRTEHRGEADVCATDPSVAWLEVVDGAPSEMVVFHGPTPLDVIAQLGEEVGRPA